MSLRRLGIVREWKTASERRAPLIPSTVEDLARRSELEVLVEPSPNRIFADEEYRRAGATLSHDLSGCDLIIGIKEMPIGRLTPSRAHMFFSHTIKAQPYNMPLLERILDLRCTLLDYELVRDERGRRLIYFGVQAGQAGMINSLWALGQRWAALGEDSPLSGLRQAREYASLDEARAALRRAGRGLRELDATDPRLPITVGITGTGNVARGARDILSGLEPADVPAEVLLEEPVERGGSPVWQVQFKDQHYARPVDTTRDFDKQHYRAHPEAYAPRFPQFLPQLSVLVTGHYWEPPFPRLVPADWVSERWQREPRPKLEVIGDVTCDPGGSIAPTVRPATPEEPAYVVDPRTGIARNGFEGEGIVVMAVDILPTEIARESSMAFDRFLAPWISGLTQVDWSRSLEQLEVSEPFRRAIIAHDGQLAPEHRHLETHLDRGSSQPPS